MSDKQFTLLVEKRDQEKTPEGEWKGIVGAFALILSLPLLFIVPLFGEDIWYWSEDKTADTAIEAYEASGDWGVLQAAAIQGDREAFRIADYLILNRHPVLVDRYRELYAIADALVPDNPGQGNQYDGDFSALPNFRRDDQYYWMTRSFLPAYDETEWPRIIDLRVFEDVLPADVSNFLPRSLVYGVRGVNFVWKYTDGSNGSQPTLNAYVLDLEERSILAASYYEGGMPSETVANYKPFSSRQGSRVDLDDVEDWYFSLSLQTTN